jgi:hypothetical protein
MLTTGSTAANSLVANAAPAPAQLPAVIASIGDLQRAGPAALQAAKAKMDVVFEAHRLRPGEAGYEYDKREAFQPSETSEWDEE